MSLNLQKELLDFQKELKELNSYSSEMKRMEKGLAEAEALASAATRAAEKISLKHREHLQETKKELSNYLTESTTTNKKLIDDFVQQFTKQIRVEVDRIGPLVNSLESDTKNHLQEYTNLLENLHSVVEDLGPKLTQHVEELQEQNSNVVSSLTADLLTLHGKHTESVTDLLQDKTNLLINAGEALQAQSKTQGKELAKVLNELYKASEFLASVSESISKTDFSAQLQGVEKELKQAGTNILHVEELISSTSIDLASLIKSRSNEVINKLKAGLEDAQVVTEENQKVNSRNFDNVFFQFKQLEQRVKDSELSTAETIAKTSTAINRLERELQQRIDSIAEQQKAQFDALLKQLNLVKQLVIVGITGAGIIGIGLLIKVLF